MGPMNYYNKVKSMNKLFFCFVASFLLASCKLSTHENNTMEKIHAEHGLGHFTDTLQGEPVSLYVLKNKKGMEVAITNYGATIVSIDVPDRGGQMADVVLGHDSIQGYYKSRAYFGCIVGRFANRIANGK